MSVQTPGVCQICQCTEYRACRLPDGDTCCWLDAARTLCNNPRCITSWARAERERRRLTALVTKRAHPWKVIARNPACHATRIVPNSPAKQKGASA